jgi:hypothetical protein
VQETARAGAKVDAQASFQAPASVLLLSLMICVPCLTSLCQVRLSWSVITVSSPALAAVLEGWNATAAGGSVASGCSDLVAVLLSVVGVLSVALDCVLCARG